MAQPPRYTEIGSDTKWEDARVPLGEFMRDVQQALEQALTINENTNMQLITVRAKRTPINIKTRFTRKPLAVLHIETVIPSDRDTAPFTWQPGILWKWDDGNVVIKEFYGGAFSDAAEHEFTFLVIGS